MQNLNKDYLNHIFIYEEGNLIYAARSVSEFKTKSAFDRWNKLFLGKMTGSHIRKDGYLGTSIKRSHFLTHRVIFTMKNGEIPYGFEIDHIDGNRKNNKIENLRLAERSQNQMNRKINKNNKSGVKGVFFRPETNKWRAVIRANNKFYRMQFLNLYDAEVWISGMRNKLHAEFANHG